MKKEDGALLSMLEKIDSKTDDQSKMITDIRVSTAKQEALFASHLQQDEKMYSKIEGMAVDLNQYNKILEVHVEGVNQARRSNDLLDKKVEALHSDVKARLRKLEEPVEFKEAARAKIRQSAKNITYLTIIGSSVLSALHWLAHVI
jgi:hypothetical protein